MRFRFWTFNFEFRFRVLISNFMFRVQVSIRSFDLEIWSFDFDFSISQIVKIPFKKNIFLQKFPKNVIGHFYFRYTNFSILIPCRKSCNFGPAVLTLRDSLVLRYCRSLITVLALRASFTRKNFVLNQKI